MKQVALIICLCGSVFTTWAQKSKGDQLYQQAKDLLDTEDFDKAANVFLASRNEYLKEKNYDRYFVATEAAIIINQDTGEGEPAEKILKEALAKIPTASETNQILHAKLQSHLGYTYLYISSELAKATDAYTASIEIYLKSGKSVEASFERINRSIVFNARSQFDKAIADLEPSIELVKERVNPEVLVGYHQMLGNNYRQIGNYQKALANLESALTYVVESDDKGLVAGLYNDLGIIYLEKGETKEALQHIDTSLDLNESAFGKDADHYARSLINRANVLEAMGDLDKALFTFQEIAAIYSQTPPANDQDLIDVLLNLSRITNSFGMTEQSQELADRALALAQEKLGTNSVLEADIYISMAAKAFASAAFDESLNYNFKALSILKTTGYDLAETFALVYNNIGQAYDELNEIDLALNYKNQAVDLYKKVFGGDNTNVAQAIGNIGLTYEMAGRYDEALTYLKESLAIRSKVQATDHDDVGTTHLNIGLIYLKQRDAKNALTHLLQAKSVYDKYTHHIKKAMIYNRLGAAYFVMNNKKESRACYQKALVANNPGFNNEQFDAFPVTSDYLGYHEQLISLLSKAELFSEIGDAASLKTAEKHMAAADQILTAKALKLNNARDRLELIQATSFFTETGIAVADKLFQTTKDAVYLEKAFYYSERNKANELLADVQRGNATEMTRVPKKLIARQREIAHRATTLEQQIASAHQARNQTLITELKTKQFDLNKEYETLTADIQKQSPKYAALVNQRTMPGWGEVKKMLEPNTALVSFIITDSSKYVLVGNQSKLMLKQLNKKVDLDKLVRGFRNFITFKSDDYKRIADQLYDHVWQPVEDALTEFGPVETLVILPDGPLSYLPFETLGKEKLLIERYNIRYSLSGAFMVSQGVSKSAKKPSFIALAPVFNDKEVSFVNKSCQRVLDGTRKTDSTSRAFDFEGNYIAPLPATEREVEQIHRIHTDKDSFARFFTKENAREELIKKGELANYDYIHFATHGIANSQYPELSALLLSQEEKGGEDGVLYTGEILGLELKADLVTLSACETALGKKIEGEGVRGLTSAFLMAGANTVVVSLWKVADESTSVFMIEFYNQLLSGNSKSAALRNAKLKLLSDPEYKHPYYWAPFVQVGVN